MAAAVLCTIVFPMQDNRVLLGRGKCGVSQDYWNGPGGKVEEGEAILTCAAREAAEESGLLIRPEDLVPMGVMKFLWLDEIQGLGRPGARVVQMVIYVAKSWEGQLRETDALGPFRWFSIDDLPLEEMHPGEGYWLARVLQGERVIGQLTYVRTEGVIRVEAPQVQPVPAQILEAFLATLSA